MSSESAWIALNPAHHFVLTADRGRRCGMCHKLIEAGERYFGSTTIDYSGAVRFHESCAEEYAEINYLPRGQP